MLSSGAFWFGVVIGFITYRTLKHKKDSGLSDIATVIGAVGGGAVLALFPMEGGRFDIYAIGLATGFFFYLVLSLVIIAVTKDGSAPKEFLGDNDA